MKWKYILKIKFERIIIVLSGPSGSLLKYIEKIQCLFLQGPEVTDPPSVRRYWEPVLYQALNLFIDSQQVIYVCMYMCVCMSVCLKCGMTERGWGRELRDLLSTWLIPQIATAAGNGPGWSQESETPTCSPMWVTEAQILSFHNLIISSVTIRFPFTWLLKQVWRDKGSVPLLSITACQAGRCMLLHIPCIVEDLW